MSTADDRLTAIQKTYLDAYNNEPSDLALAQTAADVTAIMANVASARSTYYAAEAAALTNNGPGVETAYAAAKKALAAVKKARTKAAQMATLLGALNGATSAAGSLLKLASSGSKPAAKLAPAKGG